ncbi:MAG: hypothetical protein ABJA64_01775, partial [Candidatus Saccharibacteria bacterium]
MSFLIIFLILLALLFALAFATKRRFGVLGLALTAGATLSSLWAAKLTPLVEQAGFKLVAPPLPSVVAAFLILAPALVLITSGPSYKETWQRVAGAAAFAALAGIFLLQPLGAALVLEGVGRTSYQFLIDNRVYIVTAGLIFAIIDIL